MARCVRCSREIDDRSKYCPFCGAPRGPDEPPSEAPEGNGRRLPPEAFGWLGRDASVRSGAYLRRGWELFRDDFAGCVAFAALLTAGTAILARIPVLGAFVSVLASPLWAGFYPYALRRLQGKPAGFSDFFGSTAFYVPLLLGGLVSGVLVGVGLALLIVPGLYLAVAYLFCFPLVVDRGLDFWGAMETSRKVVTRRWFGFAGFFLLLVLINLAGAALFFVGLFATVPISFFAIAAAYEDVFGIESAGP